MRNDKLNPIDVDAAAAYQENIINSEQYKSKWAAIDKEFDTANKESIGDFFNDHDTKLNKELSVFYALTSHQKDRETFQEIRDTLMDHSEDFKYAMIELKDIVQEKVGFESPSNVPEYLREEASINKLINSIDAIISNDILENGGRGYDALMETRDSAMKSKERYENSLEIMQEKNKEAQNNYENRGFVRGVVEIVKESLNKGRENEKDKELER